jgi:hypothetical protein
VSAPPDVQRAAVSEDTPLGKVLALVLAYEQGHWDDLARFARALSLDEKVLPPMYERAVKIAGDTMPKG